MSLYLGSNRVKISMGNTTYCLNLCTVEPIINGIRLLSSDDYILKDSNGLYLTIRSNE